MTFSKHLFFPILVAACGLGIDPVSIKADEPASGKPTTVDVMGKAKLTVPAEFKRVQPKSNIIQHEFQARFGDGEKKQAARITMMPAGGDVKANIRRWKGQFAGGDKEANQTEELTVGDWTVHIVDLNGSFAERMGGGPFAGGKVVQRENYAMTGAILVPPGASAQGAKYFVKMIGPAAVIKANRERLIAMIKGLQ